LLHTMSSYWTWTATDSLKALQKGRNEWPLMLILGNSSSMRAKRAEIRFTA
jgi:hypothetical protein